MTEEETEVVSEIAIIGNEIETDIIATKETEVEKESIEEDRTGIAMMGTE